MSTPAQIAAEALLLENWLRFTFIDEYAPDSFRITVPDQARQTLGATHAHLLPILDALNHQDILFETSHETLVCYLTQQFGEPATHTLLESPELERETTILQVWVQTHETELDAQPFFAQWQSALRQWRIEQGVAEGLA